MNLWLPPSGGRKASGVAVLLVALSVVAGVAQQSQIPRADKTLNEGVTAVLLDVVVRDKRGQPVRDLVLSEFEVIEDGVRQTIGSFTPVFPASPAATPVPPPVVDAPVRATPGASGGANTSPPVNDGPAVTALVFDRLSPEARRLAVQAAQAYLGTKEEAPNYIGIFGVDLALTPYAPFTRNGYVLRQALAAMAGRSSASFNSAEQRQQKATPISRRRVPPRRSRTPQRPAAKGELRRWGAHLPPPSWRKCSPT